MNDRDRDRLYQAWADAAARSAPKLDAGVRQRVLAAYEARARPRVFPAPYRFALAGFGIAVVVAVVLMLRGPAAPSFQVAGQVGRVGTWLDAPATREVAVRFSEGTLVSLGKSSRGRVTRVTRGGARIELDNGSVDAEVMHLRGADWTFGAGPFEVAVTGTHLSVLWAPATGKFELSVSRGSVLVQGPFIVGAQEVRAGQVCRVDLKRRMMELGQIAAEQAHATAGLTTADLTPKGTTPTTAPTAGDESPGPAVVTPQGSAGSARAASPESLLDEARAARLAGHPDVERALLLSCRKRAKGQPAAAQAAYLLGRASAPAQAAEWFETYLREEPQGLLAREAAGRLIESYRAAGNVTAAKSAAARYLARYPHGPHAALAGQALAAPGESHD
jgi:TolA-binding protein